MPKVKQSKKAASKAKVEEVVDTPNSFTSAIYGLVLVAAIIVAGAALFGGSLSRFEQRWASGFDSFSRGIGLSIERVQVYGLEHVPELEREVRNAAMIAEGENMFRADPYVVRRRVENTRRVANVSVYRFWPDTVVIQADAAKPAALWYDGTDWAVVDAFGRLMENEPVEGQTELMRTSGIGAAEALPVLRAALLQQPALMDHIELARRVSDRRWDLVLSSGLTLNLPVDAELESGLARFERFVMSAGSRMANMSEVDLRVPGRIIIGPDNKNKNKREAA